MTEITELAKTTISTDDVPPNERLEYLMGLPPARLRWALLNAADRAGTKGVQSDFDRLAFWLMQALGSIGETAVATDLKKVRDDAKGDVEYLIPVVVEFLNESERPHVNGDKSDEERNAHSGKDGVL